MASNTVVLGLGNLLLSDEGVGVRVVRELMAQPTDLQLIDGGTLGLELLSIAAEAERLVIVDAIDVGAQPGTVVRMDKDQLTELDRGASVHQLGVADLLSGLRLIGREPDEVVLIGVQPECLRLGTELTPAVQAAIPLVMNEVLSYA